MQEIASAFERLKKRVVVDKAGCWIWQGALSTHMYGLIKVGQKSMTTHRVAYLAANGSIPRGKVIRHRCDVRQCCNPAHLQVGDHEDNTQDLVERGRHLVRRTLTADEVQTIRAMRAAGETKRAIAVAMRCNWYAVSAAIDAAGIDAPRRPGRPRGSRNLHVRVTAETKDEIRSLYATGKYTQQQLAERFQCDQTYVSLIVRGRK